MGVLRDGSPPCRVCGPVLQCWGKGSSPHSRSIKFQVLQVWHSAGPSKMHVAAPTTASDRHHSRHLTCREMDIYFDHTNDSIRSAPRGGSKYRHHARISLAPLCLCRPPYPSAIPCARTSQSVPSVFDACVPCGVAASARRARPRPQGDTCCNPSPSSGVHRVDRVERTPLNSHGGTSLGGRGCHGLLGLAASGCERDEPFRAQRRRAGPGGASAAERLAQRIGIPINGGNLRLELPALTVLDLLLGELRAEVTVGGTKESGSGR